MGIGGSIMQRLSRKKLTLMVGASVLVLLMISLVIYVKFFSIEKPMKVSYGEF